jgi:hypothetical protein
MVTNLKCSGSANKLEVKHHKHAIVLKAEVDVSFLSKEEGPDTLKITVEADPDELLETVKMHHNLIKKEK